MDNEFIFGSFGSIWHTNGNGRVRIGIGMCNNLSIVPIYGPCRVENCIFVLIEAMNEDYEHHKLFCLVPSVRYSGSMVGIKVFWPCKYLLMNDEKIAMVRHQCHVIVDGVNNLLKKQVSCKGDSLAESFRVENIRGKIWVILLKIYLMKIMW